MISRLDCREFSKDVLFAGTGSGLSLSAGYGAMEATHSLMEGWGITFEKNPTYFSYFEGFSQVANPLARSTLKVFSIFYITIFIPIIESWFFQGVIYDWQEYYAGSKKETYLRVFRVISNALIFGAFHFSIFAGWANIPILIVSTIAGFAFAALREIKGNYRATMIAHMINNAVVMILI